jgi:hypothetical protein
MPDLLFCLLAAVVIVVNAFGRRFAGGLLSQWIGPIGGTQVARLVQAVIVGASIAALAPVWWWGAAAVPFAFAGATAGFYGRAGMMPPHPLYPGVLAHGLLAVAPLVLGAWWLGLAWWWLVAAGVLRAPAYWLAQVWSPHCPALGLIDRRRQGGAYDPPPWAEFMSGAVLGLALVLMFVGGWPR